MESISIVEALKLALEDLRSGRLSEAKAICDTILRFNPGEINALYYLGIERYQNKHYLESEKVLREALRLIGGKNVVLEEMLAHSMHESGRWKEWVDEQRAIFSTDALVLRYLELDIAYSCNLACKFCTHFSDFNKSGIVDYEDGSKWMRDWSKRVFPLTFRILGGEPMLNPRMCDYITLAAELWPQSIRALATNGFLVSRHPRLYQILAETNTRLDISIHDNTPEYLAKSNIEQIRAASEQYGFTLISGPAPVDKFNQLYRKSGDEIIPFSDNDPDKSWKNCVSPKCYFLNNGLVWKCATSALLHTIESQLGLAQNPLWLPYLDHKGMSPDATDSELMSYLLNAHMVCGMCPASP